MIEEMYNDFFKIKKTFEISDQTHVTPAVLQSVLSNNSENPENAYTELMNIIENSISNNEISDK
jgi:hypothetical protein